VQAYFSTPLFFFEIYLRTDLVPISTFGLAEEICSFEEVGCGRSLAFFSEETTCAHGSIQADFIFGGIVDEAGSTCTRNPLLQSPFDF